jgi:hypothetical protein
VRYRVVYTSAVRAQIAAQVAYMREQDVSEATIESWFGELFDIVDSLCELPFRYPLAEFVSDSEGSEVAGSFRQLPLAVPH